MSIKIHGVSISANCVGPALFCMNKKCGELAVIDFMAGEHKSPDFVKKNPWGQMPTLEDGDFCLPQTSSMLRYVANKVSPESYGGDDIRKKAVIDSAMDWVMDSFYKDTILGFVYPVMGFAGWPADDVLEETKKKTEENLKKFEGKFLTGQKFIAGNEPSIADFRIYPFMFSLGHQAIEKSKTGYVLPDRFKTYCKDFEEAIPECKTMMYSMGGFSLDEYMKSKM
mmetsp:Transcript_34387/g.70921  ORF Transcript_34387/g.70921 Transcript_34387/m.70921 type:complete len:225 (+) Transcript_34387:73-747(+)|eukprot:CAMPEP_0181319486 /NCGR_PEP_ID=MMETSP1101-20121128/17601_1 /TAXON_ID=46948 /ORGANISM="Rhodomonas abbreviata, Strain Caron Lab Isolate" /LENGTH=224 /DNA_ID=CAMNT_0023427097 /DNA_START=73 /DNA_END=747 /DNA_ORIENTATION=-